MTFPEAIFSFRRKPIFYDFFFKSSKFAAIVPPFALASSRLDWSRDVGSGTLIPLKPSDLVVSFSIVENIPWKMPDRCVAARCSNVADPKKNISMHIYGFHSLARNAR